MPVADSPFEEVTPGFRPVRAWRASEEFEQRAPRRPVNWRRVWTVSLCMLGAALLCYGSWYCLQPRHYHLVTHGRDNDAALLPSRQGFLLREYGSMFVLRDWQRGEVCWRAVVSTPSDALVHYSLSPSGRYFSALTSWPTQAHVQLWDNGKRIGDTALAPLSRASVKVLDDGRVFVWSAARGADAFLLQQGQIIARGRLLDGLFTAIAPDGSAMLSLHGGIQVAYGAISVQHGQLALTNQRMLVDQVTFWQLHGTVLDASLFNRGVVLANSGAVYDAGGQRGTATGWQHESTAPGGLFTYEHQNAEARVYSPVTGKSWSFSVPGAQQGGDASMDGQYALAWYKPRISPNLRLLFMQAPALMHNSYLATLFSRNVLALYERPGRLRAELRVEHPLADLEDWWWYPSPDGHAIVFNFSGPAGSRWQLFRW